MAQLRSLHVVDHIHHTCQTYFLFAIYVVIFVHHLL